MDKKMVEARLAELKQNYAAGQEQLRAMEQRQAELKQTLLRIHGAVQVLEEMLAESASDSDTGANPG